MFQHFKASLNVVNTNKVEPYLISKNSRPTKIIQYFMYIKVLVINETDVLFPSVPDLFSSVKLPQLLGHEPLLDCYLGLVDLKVRQVGQTAGHFCFVGCKQETCIPHLKGFTHSNDAVQMAAEVAQYTLSSSHGDFLFVDIYLFLQQMGCLFKSLQHLKSLFKT